MAVIGYIRVSTDKQTYAHQRLEIEQYANIFPKSAEKPQTWHFIREFR